MTLSEASGSPFGLLVAGPNGAGKTTFSRTYLPLLGYTGVFLNADLIAAGLSPLAPERAAHDAARLLLERLDACVLARESFVLETTLSGRGYAQAIPRWRAAGFRVFLDLPSADAAVRRVATRVRRGGHDIPEDVIRRRFHAGRWNFDHLYKPLVDEWVHLDGSPQTPRWLGEGRRP